MIRLLLIVLSVCLPAVAHAQQKQQDFEKLMNDFLYGGLKKIESFGFIHVHVKNADDNRLGLKSEELTDYLKLRYKNNFANVAFTDQSKHLGDIKNNDRTGYLWCGVWTVGDDFPVAYHVECKAGSFENPTILSDTVLGYGNKRNVPETIKKSIDEIISRFAIQFYKTRGEM